MPSTTKVGAASRIHSLIRSAGFILIVIILLIISLGSSAQSIMPPTNLPAIVTDTNAAPMPGSPYTLLKFTPSASPDVVSYNVYASTNLPLRLFKIGSTTDLEFITQHTNAAFITWGISAVNAWGVEGPIRICNRMAAPSAN